MLYVVRRASPRQVVRATGRCSGMEVVAPAGRKKVPLDDDEFGQAFRKVATKAGARRRGPYGPEGAAQDAIPSGSSDSSDGSSDASAHEAVSGGEESDFFDDGDDAGVDVVTSTTPGVEKEHIRNGYKVKFNGKVIGRLTSWGSSLSCVCSLHRQCKTKAMSIRRAPEDHVFMDWLLSALAPDGTVRLEQPDHVRAMPA